MMNLVKNNRGQLAVTLALIFPLFVLLFAFLINLGLLIHERIRLQNAVDAGVYSATASLARDLNKITELNENIDALFQGDADDDRFEVTMNKSMKEFMESDTFNEEVMIKAQFDEYINKYGELIGKMHEVRDEAFGKAVEIGRRAAYITYTNQTPKPFDDSGLSNFNFQQTSDSEAEDFFDYQEFKEELMGYFYNVWGGSWTDPCGMKPGCSADDIIEEYEREINIPVAKINHVSFQAQSTAPPTACLPVSLEMKMV